ncbi:MAG: hypothetical protein WKF37_11740 [Bryobacteraceae bacterium]
MSLKLLKDLWIDPNTTDELELLRYRSNLLGADLRITNFGGGNTSSKFELQDPFTGRLARVLAVKEVAGILAASAMRVSRCYTWSAQPDQVHLPR